MPIYSVALFGSRARGDAAPDSDVDMLLITSDTSPRHNNLGNISLSIYPRDFLESKSRNGDLFVLHLVSEAKLIYDENGTFQKLKDIYRFRDNYQSDLSMASQVGWFILKFYNQFESTDLLNRKIAWSLRTILIARAAQLRMPVFSSRDLALFASSDAVSTIIAMRNEAGINNEIMELFFPLLEEWGVPDKMPMSSLPEDYFREFASSQNSVGVQIYNRALLDAEPSYL